MTFDSVQDNCAATGQGLSPLLLSKLHTHTHKHTQSDRQDKQCYDE